MIEIRKYTANDYDQWNDFLQKSKNGLFQFHRKYMEYHKGRFEDCSLMFYRDGMLFALLPANISDDVMYSHQGLTFGGLVLHDKITFTDRVMDCFGVLIKYLKDAGIKKLVYKAIPYIYHKTPSQEDLYALFRMDAKISRVEANTAIDLSNRGYLGKKRRGSIKKSQKCGLLFLQTNKWQESWSILCDVLKEKFDTKPTHTLQEITQLHNNFPDNIKLFTAELDKKVLACVVMYETSDVAHTQYICSANEGQQYCAVDGLLEYLIQLYTTKKYKYFNFGISNEDAGQYLNVPLIKFKENFGGSTTAQQTFIISI